MKIVPSLLTITVGCVLLRDTASGRQLKEVLQTKKGRSLHNPVPHSLEWWTHDPLRGDTDGDLMLGRSTPHGHTITARDYSTQQKIETIGEISGLRIVQVMTYIHPGPEVIAAGWATLGEPPGVWKDLLVAAPFGDQYIDIYAVHDDMGGLYQMSKAAIYGKGPEAILSSYDPGAGNGGGCADGYWWFDRKGPHEVNFSPVFAAVRKVIPPGANFTERCWALHPETLHFKSGVQKEGADCKTCGGLGEVEATYKIEAGSARPVSVHFDPK